MISPCKPRLGSLRTRATPAVFGLPAPALQAAYPPSDPALPLGPPLPSDRTPIVMIPAPLAPGA